MATYKLRVLLACLFALVMLDGCRSAYYATYEKFGIYKRDLLQKKVVAARDDQKAASEQFKDALTRLKELYGFEGGDLEKAYSGIKSDYDRSVERANAVHKRIADVETIAGDLFAEWQKEIKEISSDVLRRSSEEKLRETQRRYDELHAALKQKGKGVRPAHDDILPCFSAP